MLLPLYVCENCRTVYAAALEEGGAMRFVIPAGVGEVQVVFGDVPRCTNKSCSNYGVECTKMDTA